MKRFNGTTELQPMDGSRAWVVAGLLGTGSLVILFDSLAVATALPVIGRDLERGPAELQWVVSLYSVSIGSVMLLGGRICDVFGARPLLVGSLVVCGVGGLVAGLAPSFGMLLVGRVIQGVAAAGAVPAALSLASSIFPEEPWQSRALSVIAMAAWLAAVAGAVLGGLVASAWGWRWIFLLTVPVAAVAAVGLVYIRMPSPSPNSRVPLDVAGAALACVGLLGLLLGVDRFGHQAWGVGALVVVVSLLLLAGFVRLERRVQNPLVPGRLLTSPRIVGACLGFGAYCAGYVALVVVTSLFLQSEYGFTPARTGLFLVPMLVVGTLSALVAPRVVRNYGARRVTVAALTLCAVAMTGLSASRPEDPMLLLLWLIPWGIGSGPVFVGLTREVLAHADAEDSGVVAAVFESMSHVGGGLAASAYLTLLAVGVGFGVVQGVAALVVGIGAVTAAAVLPRSGPGDSPRDIDQVSSRVARRRSA